MQESFDEIKNLGANLVAISPQLIRYSKQMKNKHEIEFDVLSDKGNKVADKFNLKFAFPDYLIEIYKNFGSDLERFNGDDSWTLPMPARYVIGQNGIITAADVHPDYTKRPEPSQTVADLEKLQEK